MDLLEGPGAYTLGLAVGDATFANNPTKLTVRDGVGGPVLLTLDLGNQPAGSFYDATGVLRTAAQWPANQATVQVDVSTSVLAVTLGDGLSASSTNLAHLFLAKVAGGTPIAKASTSSAEWLATQSRALAAAAAWDQQIARAPAIAVESLAALSWTGTVSAEVLARRDRVALVPWEALTGIAEPRVSSVEWGQSVVRASSPAAEWLRAIAAGPPLSVESLQSVAAPGTASVESLRSVLSTNAAAVEFLARLQRAGVAWWEAAGSGVAITVTSAAAVEWLSSVAALRTVAAEVLAGVNRAGAAPAEILAGVRRVVPASVEILAGRGRQIVIPVEALASVGRVSAGAAEILAALTRGAVVAVAWDGSAVTIRILRDRDHSGHRFQDIDFSAARLRDRDHSEHRLRDIDHSGAS